MMVSLRWVIFINFGLTFLFFFEFWQSSKRKLVGRGLFLNFCHPGNSKKNKKQSGCFFYFFEFRESSKRKLVGRCLFFLFFFAIPEIPKKTKKTASCFWDFFQFLNFGNPQKESWWEESFFFWFL